MIYYFFEILPIVLAIISAILCSIKYSSYRRQDDKVIMILAVFCSILLIIAQTSWWTSYIIENSLEGTRFANATWTVFNNVTMIIFISLAIKRK